MFYCFYFGCKLIIIIIVIIVVVVILIVRLLFTLMIKLFMSGKIYVFVNINKKWCSLCSAAYHPIISIFNAMSPPDSTLVFF